MLKFLNIHKFKILVILIVLLFRIFYSVNLDFWNEDEMHIYLMGLEWFSLGDWPFFGPDVIHTETQIPGALQALSVGLGFFIFPIPEMPFVLLNIVSISALIMFSIYLNRLIPRSFILTFLWLSSLPWTLEIGTHIYNPSYLLFPTIIFFISFFELHPKLSTGWWSRNTCLVGLGFSLGCIVQLHLSWPLLIPFLLLAFMYLRKEKISIFKFSTPIVLGSLFPLLLLIPTLIEFGFAQSSSSGTSNMIFNFKNLSYFFNNLVRLLSYGTYETTIFIGESAADRKKIILENWWMIPFSIPLTILGYLQVLWFLFGVVRFLKDKNPIKKASSSLMILILVLSSLIFCLTTRPPISRNFYLLLPVVLLFSWQWISNHLDNNRWKKVIYTMIAFSFIHHFMLSFARYSDQGLYKNRELVLKSIINKDYLLFETPRYDLGRKKTK